MILGPSMCPEVRRAILTNTMRQIDEFAFVRIGQRSGKSRLSLEVLRAWASQSYRGHRVNKDGVRFMLDESAPRDRVVALSGILTGKSATRPPWFDTITEFIG